MWKLRIDFVGIWDPDLSSWWQTASAAVARETFGHLPASETVLPIKRLRSKQLWAVVVVEAKAMLPTLPDSPSHTKGGIPPRTQHVKPMVQTSSTDNKV